MAGDDSLANVVEMIGVVESLEARGLERGVGLVDIGDVDVDRRFAADTVAAVLRHGEDAVVVEHRRGDGQGAVVVVGGRALEVVSAQVKEAMVGLAAQVVDETTS